MIKIIGHESSINVRKVLWTCAELDQAYELISLNDLPDQSALKKLNPNELAPIIIDEGFILWESNAICQYLCESKNGTHLYPASAQKRALVDQWMGWQATEFNTAWRYAFMGLVRQHENFSDQAQIAKSLSDWEAAIDIISGQLEKQGPFMTGEAFSLADIIIGLSVNRWMKAPVQKTVRPVLDGYIQRLKSDTKFEAFSEFV